LIKYFLKFFVLKFYILKMKLLPLFLQPAAPIFSHLKTVTNAPADHTCPKCLWITRCCFFFGGN